MSHVEKVLNAFIRLLSYPDEQTTQSAELLYVVLQSEIDEAAADAARFGSFLEQHEPWEVEEAFTRTFDVNPACALEVGWHLFGEEYARGMFLVRMRQELRKFNLPESAELPDHITHVLAVVAAMPDDEAAWFVRACVQPAIEKMREALAKTDSPYRFAVASLASVIKQKWGEMRESVLESQPNTVDPLRAYPVADVGCSSGCGGTCGDQVDVVPLELGSPAADATTNSTNSSVSHLEGKR